MQRNCLSSTWKQEPTCKIAKHVSQALGRSGIKCEGINLYPADGEAAAQDIFHVHSQVIPRLMGDGFYTKFGINYGLKPNRKELIQLLKKQKGNALEYYFLR